MYFQRVAAVLVSRSTQIKAKACNGSVRPLSAGQWWQPFIERWRFCNIGFSTLAKARKNDSPWVEQVKAIKGLNASIT